MAATMLIREKNGAGETPTNKTGGTIRFKNADDANVDTSNPMVVPGAGSDWSFEKWLRMNVDGAFTEISNLKFYTDGANGYGTGILQWAKAVASFATPAEGTGSAGYSDAFGYTSGAPLSLGAGPFDSTGVPKDIGSYLVMLAEVQSTASQGAKPAETMTLAWDEI